MSNPLVLGFTYKYSYVNIIFLVLTIITKLSHVMCALCVVSDSHTLVLDWTTQTYRMTD
jgi:hypothetical protein